MTEQFKDKAENNEKEKKDSLLNDRKEIMVNINSLEKEISDLKVKTEGLTLDIEKLKLGINLEAP